MEQDGDLNASLAENCKRSVMFQASPAQHVCSPGAVCIGRSACTRPHCRRVPVAVIHFGGEPLKSLVVAAESQALMVP